MKYAFAVVVALSVASAALAQGAPGAGRVQAGRQVASHFCAECHAVDRTGQSPFSAAPPMPELYRTFPVERMDEALRAGLIDDHSEWLLTKLSAREREALTAYLSSFAPAGRPAEGPRLPEAPLLPTRQMVIAGL